MQGVLIDDHRIHVDFSQSVRGHCFGRIIVTDIDRSPSSLTPGGTRQIQREPSNLEDLGEYQAWRSGVSTERRTQTHANEDMVWYLTRTIYATIEATMNRLDPVEGLAVEHGVEVGALDVRTTLLSTALGGIEVAEIVEVVMSGTAKIVVMTNGSGIGRQFVVSSSLSGSLKHRLGFGGV